MPYLVGTDHVLADAANTLALHNAKVKLNAEGFGRANRLLDSDDDYVDEGSRGDDSDQLSLVFQKSNNNEHRALLYILPHEQRTHVLSAGSRPPSSPAVAVQLDIKVAMSGPEALYNSLDRQCLLSFLATDCLLQANIHGIKPWTLTSENNRQCDKDGNIPYKKLPVGWHKVFPKSEHTLLFPGRVPPRP